MSVFCFIDRWSSVTIAGQAPPPCSSFTLTKVGEKRAAMFGGWSGSETSSDLLFVELGRYCVVSIVCTLLTVNYACGLYRVLQVTRRGENDKSTRPRPLIQHHRKLAKRNACSIVYGIAPCRYFSQIINYTLCFDCNGQSSPNKAAYTLLQAFLFANFLWFWTSGRGIVDLSFSPRQVT